MDELDFPDNGGFDTQRSVPWVLIQVSPGVLVKVYAAERQRPSSGIAQDQLRQDLMQLEGNEGAQDAGCGASGAAARGAAGDEHRGDVVGDGSESRSGRAGGEDESGARNVDPISKVVIPVPDLSEALRFWQFAMGLNNEDASDPACLTTASYHLLKLYQQSCPRPSSTNSVGTGTGVGGGGGGGCGNVKLGLMFPESWLAGVSEVATQEFGCKLLTPMVVLDTPGRGRLTMLDLLGPGGSVIRLMSEEDMMLIAPSPDVNAHLQLEREMEIDDTDERLHAETARFEAENVLRSAGRKVPGEIAPQKPSTHDYLHLESEILRVEATQEQLAKLVWLHGGGLHSYIRHELTDDVPQGWACMSANSDMPWLNLILPTAQQRSLKFLGNLVRPSWFDLEMEGVMAEISPLRMGSENVQHLQLSSLIVADIVRDEKDQYNDPVVLGGFGPGAVTALWTLISAKYKGPRPDALILCNCWAPLALMRPKNMDSLVGLPILVVIAGKDPIVPLHLQIKLANTLKKLGFNVTVCQFPSISHTVNVCEQGSAIRDFMLQLVRQGGGNERLHQIQVQRQAAEEKEEMRQAGVKKNFEKAFGLSLEQPEFEGAQEVPITQEYINVTFQLHKSSYFVGQKVFLSGSACPLGQWDTQHMVPLETSASTFPIWSVTVPLPVFAKTAYRYYTVTPATDSNCAEPVRFSDCAREYVCVCVSKHIHTRARTCTHTNVCTHMHMHMHMHIQVAETTVAIATSSVLECVAVCCSYRHMHLFIHICIHAYVHHCIELFVTNTYMHTYIHTCKLIDIHTHIHTQEHTSTHMHTLTYTHTSTHKHIHTYLPTYIQTYKKICMQTYIHTNIQNHLITYMFLRTHIPACAHTHKSTFLYVYPQSCMHTQIYTHTRIHSLTHTNTRIQTQTYTHIRTHTHTHTHTHTQVAETTGVMDSLFVLGDMRQMGDSQDASASIQLVRPQRLEPPPSTRPEDVHEIVSTLFCIVSFLYCHVH